MAKKKKSSLAPVNRGFATTSQPRKPTPVSPVKESTEEKSKSAPGEKDADDRKEDAKNSLKEDGSKAKDVGTLNGTGDEWEDEFQMEEGIYQGYVERLQEKGEKEINRIVKAIDFDKRMNKGFIRLHLDERLADEVIEYNKQTTEALAPRTLQLPTGATQEEKEKILQKLYINFGVLTRLGYSEEEVVKCLKVVGEKASWEEGLDWLLVNTGDE